MDSAKLNDWMQVIGIFAVVASLIFVGLEMRQDRQIALSSQFQQRVDTALTLWNGFAESEYDVSRTGSFFVGNPAWDGVLGETASPEDFGDAYISARKTFVVLENHHFQYLMGFYDEETWFGFRGQIRRYLASNPFAQNLVRHNDAYFRPQFLELCEQILAEIERNN